jgi:hypothetical protein
MAVEEVGFGAVHPVSKPKRLRSVLDVPVPQNLLEPLPPSNSIQMSSLRTWRFALRRRGVEER